MKFKRWMPRVLVFLLAMSSGLLYVRSSKGQISYRPKKQPIAFNHFVHVHENELACEDCHQGVKTGYRATLPTTETCSLCHSEPQGSSTKEKALIEGYIKEGKPILWQRLFVLPDHAVFSHRIHVVRGGIACQDCHGPMDMQKEPPRRLLKVLTMDDCMDCHKQQGALLDCNGCHR